MHHLYRILIALLSISVLLIGCDVQPVAPADETTAAQLIPLRVQTLPYLSFSPYFIAQEEGYFTQQGLAVEFVRFQRSAEAIPALVQGELDVLSGAMSFGLLNAMARNAKIKLVADKGYVAADGCTDVAILARKNLQENATTENSLIGKRVAVNQLSIRGYMLAKALEEQGASLDAAAMKTVEIVDLADPVVGEAFADGTLDYVVTAEPWTTRLVEQGVADIWLPAQELAPELQIGLITYGPNLLTKAPDVGERFMIAYLQGVRQYNEGKTERNLEIIAQYTELPVELLQQVCWGAMRNGGTPNIESVLAFQAWGVAMEAVDSPVTENAIFESRFIDYANAHLAEEMVTD